MIEKAQESYNELAYYTLSHKDPAFIHQHIVDAYAAQMADEKSKPITVAFALMGLYLYLEKGYLGKDVQRAHMKMAEVKKTWPKFELPQERGNITAKNVLAELPGEARDLMIRKWAESVWAAWHGSHGEVESLVKKEL